MAKRTIRTNSDAKRTPEARKEAIARRALRKFNKANERKY